MTRMFAYTPILMDATKRILVCKEPAVILEGRTRFWTVGLGKGCALSVLLMSLSNQMSLLTGIEYFDTASFFLCLAVALVLVGLLKPLQKPVARLALSLVSCGLALMWVVLLIYLQAATSFDSAVPEILLVLYGFSGRIVTLLLNIHWNYHCTLNTLDENPRCVAFSILCALGLFLLYLARGGFFAQCLVIGALGACAVLATATSWTEFRNRTGDHDAETIYASDQAHSLTSEGHGMTRVLYFGSRVLYGLLLGVLVWLGATSAPTRASRTLALMGVLGALVGLAFVAARLLTPRGNSAAAIASPVAAFLLLWTAFYPEAASHPLCLYAALADLTWTAQNLFQLPSYRRICRLPAAFFAYADYIAQIIPYYLVVWLLSSCGDATRYLQVQGVAPQTLGTVCIIVLMAFSIGAMVRHAMRYLPRPPAPPSVDSTPSSAVADSSLLDALTPRERDVFALMAAGYSRSYIGKVLYISPDTVKVHARHIYAKLDIASKDELIQLADNQT